MAQFEAALQLLLLHEGTNFVDNPDDSGQATRYGISLKFYKSRIQPDATPEVIKNLTVNDAAAIYNKFFWERAPFDQIINQKLANRLFDLAVNCGLKEAITLLQRAVNSCLGHHLTVDGTLGIVTLKAVNSMNDDILYDALIDQAEIFYKDIAQFAHNSQFYAGWIHRLNDTP